jgi:hypothetical protein
MALAGAVAAIAAIVAQAALPSASHRAQLRPARLCDGPRWAVKTLRDKPRLLPVRNATVGYLVSRRLPRRVPSTRLRLERYVFRVRAAVTRVRRERDLDVQAVLRDGTRQMIAEAPSPSCTRGAAPIRRRQMAHARKALRLCPRAVITGVAFLDYVDRNRRRARNGIELAPILGFRCLEPPPPSPPPPPAPPPPPPAPPPPPPPASVDKVVFAVGDFTACQGSNCSTVSNSKAVHDLISSQNPDALIGLGDYQYDNIGTILNGWNLMYGPKPGGLYAKTYPTAGPGHDVASCTDNRYEIYFGRGAQAPYSFDLGAWRILSLPSAAWVYGCNPTAVTAWIQHDLANNPTKCTLAFLHEPYWTRPSTSHSRTIALKPWIQALYDGGVDLLLQAHQHDYQRFYPQNLNDVRDDARGIQAFVVGTGGANLVSFTGTAPNVAASDSTTYGALKLTLHSDSYDWQFQRAAGGTFTDGPGRSICH